MRDRLVELIESTRYWGSGTSAEIADYILADGWMRLPYDCGQTVYVVRSKTSNGKNLYLKEERVDHYRVFKDGRFMCFESGRTSVSDHLWETRVFPTREDAEKALRGGEDK